MFAISPTDLNWFHFNKRLNHSNQVNFWTPTPWNIKRLSAGDKLYFMLKSPVRKIGGFGIFEEYINLNVNEAWNRFGLGNGVSSKEELLNSINIYLQKHTQKSYNLADHQVGCIILNYSEFWEEEQYIDINTTTHDFKKNIVKIKYFDEYDNIMSNFKSFVNEVGEFIPIDRNNRVKRDSRQTIRFGQSEFRSKLLIAYANRCCVTGIERSDLLEAAHIQPYLGVESNHVQNGLLLRIDFHKLFDKGLMYIDDSYKIHISPLLKDSYYQSFNFMKIRVPKDEILQPSKEALRLQAKNFRV